MWRQPLWTSNPHLPQDIDVHGATNKWDLYPTGSYLSLVGDPEPSSHACLQGTWKLLPTPLLFPTSVTACSPNHFPAPYPPPVQQITWAFCCHPVSVIRGPGRRSCVTTLNMTMQMLKSMYRSFDLVLCWIISKFPGVTPMKQLRWADIKLLQMVNHGIQWF